MPNKYQLITEMANETLKEITSNAENWTKFLNTAGNNYKYSFNEQVLIYAQKPNATACADIDTWNKRLKRWVNGGARGIALIKIENGKNVLRHVFDISDTHSVINQELKLWEVKPSYENGLIETLENSFGNLEIKDNLAEAIYSSSFNLVEDNFQDYLVDLKEVIENSSLQNLSDSELESFFKGILVNSVAYMTMKRCGIDPMEHFSLSDFELISQFNNKRVIARLGAATSDIAEQELREIYSSVRNFEKFTNYINRTFVNNEKSDYHINENKNNERRNEYDRSNIPTNGRLSNTTSSITKNEEIATREILKNEGEIPKRTQKRIIRGINARWQDGGTFRRGRTNISKEIKTNNQETSREKPSKRRNETNKSNEMGSRNELNKEPGRGNGNNGTNLQLNLFTDSYIPPIQNLPSVEEQINNIQTQVEVENASTFSFTQEMIDNMLLEGSGFEQGKFRIYEQLLRSLSTKENIDFLKKEYGDGGSSSIRDFDGIGQWHSSKGIELHKGYKDNAPKLLLTWNKVEQRLKELIKLERYFTPEEKLEYRKWLESKEQTINTQETDNSISPEILSNMFDTIISHQNIDIDLLKDNTKTFDEKMQMLRDRCEYYANDFGGFNPTDGYFNITEDVIEINLYDDDSFHTIEWEDFTNLFIEHANRENNIENIEKNYKLSNGNYFHFHTNEEGYYYAIYNNFGTEIDGGLLEYSEIDNIRQSELDIRKRLADFTDIEELTNENLREVSQEFIDNLEAGVIAEEVGKAVLEKVENDAINIVNELKERDIEQAQNVLNLFKAREENGKPLDRDEYYTKQEKINYHIDNNSLGEGTPKEKVRRNIEAIKLLRKLEDENRLANKEEQEILAGYVGWGGLPDVFDENKTNWNEEYHELKEILSDDEYKSARSSTLTAFYTPPIVIKAIYQTLQNMGAEQANILEPSCGTGNFLGMIPQNMESSKLYGVELDTISGKIAKQLYQKANIKIEGYEKANLQDSFFDIAIRQCAFWRFQGS